MHALSHRVTSEAPASDQEVWPMITAALDDGPLRGMRIEAQVIDGRRPSTVDVLVDDGQHVPLLSLGLDPERSVRGVHVSLPEVDAP